MRCLCLRVVILGGWLFAFSVPPVTAAGVTGSDSSGSSGSSGSPQLRLRQIHMVETRGGSRLWEVWADHAEVQEREGYTVLSRVSRPVQVTLYSSFGQVTCTANQATVDIKTKDVRLTGAVIARSDQGTELRTEALQWLAASRRLVTDQVVTLTRGGLLTRGRGLEAETDLEQVRILRNITSLWRPPGATGPLPSGTRTRTSGRSGVP